MRSHNGIELLEEMPDGWRLDSKTGSPLHGYSFATDGKSILRGGKRALVRVLPPQRALFSEAAASQKIEPSTITAATSKPKTVAPVDPNFPKALNDLARNTMKLKLLADIRIDLQVCEIEGWSKAEYIRELQELIGSFATSNRVTANY